MAKRSREWDDYLRTKGVNKRTGKIVTGTGNVVDYGSGKPPQARPRTVSTAPPPRVPVAPAREPAPRPAAPPTTRVEPVSPAPQPVRPAPTRRYVPSPDSSRPPVPMGPPPVPGHLVGGGGQVMAPNKDGRYYPQISNGVPVRDLEPYTNKPRIKRSGLGLPVQATSPMGVPLTDAGGNPVYESG